MSAPIQTNDQASAPEATAAASTTGNLLDQIKPKLRELVQEVIQEEQKLRGEVSKVDLEQLLRKLPGLPLVAHQLPDSTKQCIKKLLGSKAKSVGFADGPVKVSDTVV